MNRIAAWFEREWRRPSAWRFLLRPLSWFFRALGATRSMAYQRGWFRSARLPVPVIIVGNISVGGSGKTPLVIWLVEQLRLAGYVPGVISRGYGGIERGPFEVGPFSDPVEVGDEPVLIAARTEVAFFIGRDRVAAGNALLAAHPNCDVIVSDDGLQHYRLRRDIEIIVVDGQAGFGNGCLLPAGPLREPVSRLHTADFVVINHGSDDQATKSTQLAVPMGMPGQPMALGHPVSMRLTGQVFYNAKDPNQHALAADLRHEIVHAVAGIGRPRRFFDHLRQLGLNIVEHPFPDHHAYRREDLAFGADSIVAMTEKDAVKCRAFAGDSWWVLAVSAQLDDRFFVNLLRKLRPVYGPQTT